MSEIEDLKAQMAAMMAMMNKQQALHEQEIKDLQGRYSGPSSGPPGPSTNIRIKQPETYDSCKDSVDCNDPDFRDLDQCASLAGARVTLFLLGNVTPIP